MVQRRRTPTSTSTFGSGRRESHDSTAFYDRFRAPVLSDDDVVTPPFEVEQPFVCGDSRKMDEIPDRSVALVVTSPPYFAGKAYEEELGKEGVPASYVEYLQLLRDVFAECTRKLEPGGRIAVNVANLGRKPYRSLSADVISLLQDDLGLLLRGEIVWQKGEGASGSCAWGSFRSATNPVIRDLTERVIVASKGRFDRARTPEQRAREGLPFESSLTADEFMASTLDLWQIPPESAKRLGHPAPFPVELPETLIRLYTFCGDLVLDPFMGSGSTLVAAARLGRRYAGYDTDPSYVEIAERRVKEALGGVEAGGEGLFGERPDVARAIREGLPAGRLAERVLVGAGFEVIGRQRRVPGTGVSVPLVARDRSGSEWRFDVGGPFTSTRGGLWRTETVWRCLGRAAALSGRPSPSIPSVPLVLLTTELPRPGTDGHAALRSAGPGVLFDVVDVLSEEGTRRLALYASGLTTSPAAGFWSKRDLARWPAPVGGRRPVGA